MNPISIKKPFRIESQFDRFFQNFYLNVKNNVYFHKLYE